ncbi:MAG: hypothetical protein P4K98_10795 [Bryobacteraceae bacterium]|nr:hypothetical protein [Bryobacteraceae bacterium]
MLVFYDPPDEEHSYHESRGGRGGRGRGRGGYRGRDEGFEVPVAEMPHFFRSQVKKEGGTIVHLSPVIDVPAGGKEEKPKPKEDPFGGLKPRDETKYQKHPEEAPKPEPKPTEERVPAPVAKEPALPATKNEGLEFSHEAHEAPAAVQEHSWRDEPEEGRGGRYGGRRGGFRRGRGRPTYRGGRGRTRGGYYQEEGEGNYEAHVG